MCKQLESTEETMTCYHIKGVAKDRQDFRGETITSGGEIKEDLQEDMASDRDLKEQVALGVVGLVEVGLEEVIQD